MLCSDDFIQILNIAEISWILGPSNLQSREKQTLIIEESLKGSETDLVLMHFQLARSLCKLIGLLEISALSHKKTTRLSLERRKCH